MLKVLTTILPLTFHVLQYFMLNQFNSAYTNLGPALNHQDEVEKIRITGILECHRPDVMEKEAEKAKILCEAQLIILKYLAQSNVFGPQVLQKHTTK